MSACTYIFFFSSPCQRQCELLPSLGIRRPLTFHILIFSSEKSQMNWNLVGSIYGRFFIKIAHFVPIHWQTWSPQAILVSDWPISNNLLLWNCLAKWAELWWEAPIEGSVCIKLPQSRMKGERHRLSGTTEPLFSVSKARTFVVSQLVTNVALIEYT